MKKNFLFTLVIMLMTAISSFAQNEQKEYNMVITLNNGTTVTLGHNDIKNITFNNGEISISGDVISTIDNLQQRTDEQRQLMDYLYTKIQDNANVNADQDAKIQKLGAVFTDGIQEVATTLDAKIANMANAVDENFALYGKAISALSEGQEQQSQVNENLWNSIDMIITYMEKFHPELAGAKEMKAAKAAIATARKK